MPLDNSLNVSELLRRLGVKGDSLGSAPLLESLRLSLQIGDLSDLVPPVGVPLGGAAISGTAGVGTNNRWSLECRSPGGLMVTSLDAGTGGGFRVNKTANNVLGAVASTAAFDFAFGQEVQSIFRNHIPGVLVLAGNSFRIQGIATNALSDNFLNWVGPGEFFNIESVSQNLTEVISISWKEYPAGINPG